MLTLTRLPLPCTLNSLYRAVVLPGAKWPRQILSKRGRELGKRLVSEMVRQTNGMARPIFPGPVSIADLTIVPPDKRVRDIDCYDKQLFDSLTKAGIIADDRHIIHYGGREMLAPQRPGWITMTLVDMSGQ